MSVKYNIGSTRLSSLNIGTVTAGNSTILDTGNDSSGGYYLKVQPDLWGCGSTQSFAAIEIKDDIPWTKISYEIVTSGSSSCWTFNDPGWGGMTYTYQNLMPFNSSLDTFAYAENSFNVSGVVFKMMACDGNSTTNFWLAGDTSKTRKFFVTRRRNTSSSGLASINVNWSCNSTGAGSYVIFRNIFVW